MEEDKTTLEAEIEKYKQNNLEAKILEEENARLAAERNKSEMEKITLMKKLFCPRTICMVAKVILIIILYWLIMYWRPSLSYSTSCIETNFESDIYSKTKKLEEENTRLAAERNKSKMENIKLKEEIAELVTKKNKYEQVEKKIEGDKTSLEAEIEKYKQNELETTKLEEEYARLAAEWNKSKVENIKLKEEIAELAAKKNKCEQVENFKFKEEIARIEADIENWFKSYSKSLKS